jgi:hypothetical protein
MKEALRQLKELQAERRDHHKTEMDDAIRLLKTQEMKGLPYEPAAYKFAEIGFESGRRDRLQDSLRAEKADFNLAEYLHTQPRTTGDLVAVAFPRRTGQMTSAAMSSMQPEANAPRKECDMLQLSTLAMPLLCRWRVP